MKSIWRTYADCLVLFALMALALKPATSGFQILARLRKIRALARSLMTIGRFLSARSITGSSTR